MKKVRLGIDLGGSFIKAGIIDDSYKILHRVATPSLANRGAAYVKQNLQNACNLLLEAAAKKGLQPVSLGIGSPGTISQPLGIVEDASPNIKEWRGTNLTAIFGKINIKIAADNDANCAALAEYLVGYKCRYKNIVFITVGTGIGGGLIIDGRLYRGSTFAGTEIGHSVLKYNGRLCKCGRRGCLEAYTSVPNLLKRARFWATKLNMRLKSTITPNELFKMYLKRNLVARKAIEENADYLGTALGSLVNVINPEAVISGGGFSEAGQEYIRLIDSAIRRYAFKAAARSLKVAGARLGNDAGLIGAALLEKVKEDGSL